MRILIIEDEPPTARYIERSVRAILGDRVRAVRMVHSLGQAQESLKSETYDLCLLDLNLSGQDGFDLLRQAASRRFQTIVISAHIERAIEAFDYGVLDFVPKPFDKDRLCKAIERYKGKETGERRTVKFLAYRLRGEHRALPVENVVYFEASRYLVQAHVEGAPPVLLEKSIQWLESVLPPSFLRVHRSYIAAVSAIESYRHTGGSIYKIRLKSGVELPLSRPYLTAVRKALNG